MARRWRLSLVDIPMHITHRGNNRSRIFLAEHDYRHYLACLAELESNSNCEIHAFALMPNHIHILLTPRAAMAASRLMKRLEQRHAQFINRYNKRTGALYEGRFRSSVVEDTDYLFNCYRYIELNPVRARLVDHPSEYAWSSYMSNAEGVPSFLLTPHRQFIRLGREDEDRRAAYRAMFRKPLDEEMLHEMRGTARGELALGSAQFKVRWTQGPTPGSDPGVRPRSSA
jgi:putative transposase